jgi:hypothetical protein
VSPSHLSPAAVLRVKRWTERRLRSVPGVVKAAGCVEIVLNVVNNAAPIWSPHAHVVVRIRASRLRDAKRVLKLALKGQPNRAAGIYRTIVIKRVTDLNGALRYITKFWEEGSVYRRSTWDGPAGRCTRKQSLKKSEFDEVQELDRQLYLHARLILVGMKRTKAGLTFSEVK